MRLLTGNLYNFQGHEKYLGSCNSLNSQKDTTVHETSVIKDELPLEFSAINCVERSSYLKRYFFKSSFRLEIIELFNELNKPKLNNEFILMNLIEFYILILNFIIITTIDCK